MLTPQENREIKVQTYVQYGEYGNNFLVVAVNGTYADINDPLEEFTIPGVPIEALRRL